MNPPPSIADVVGPNAELRRRRIGIWRWLAIGAAAAVFVWLGVRLGTTPAQHEATRWLLDFAVVRQQPGDRRIPDWPLSFAAQQVLVDRLVAPESRLARRWEAIRQKLSPAVRRLTPRLPLARDQVLAVGPALIELPKSTALRTALLEAALRTNAVNRQFAVQFAGSPWPVSDRVLPLLERLATDSEPFVRLQTALLLHGIPSGNVGADRLLSQLATDQISAVRETAAYSYRSDAEGNPIEIPRTNAPKR